MSLEQHMEQLKQSMLNEIEHSKKIVFKGLIEEPMINVLPESIFSNYFLPHFLGNVVNPNWLTEWISIAGTPMAPLAVIDDRTKERLFVVPGILYTNNIFREKTEGDLGDIFAKYDMLNSNLPINGLRFLLQALNENKDLLLSNMNMDPVNTAWYEIFKRYNLVDSSTNFNNANFTNGSSVTQQTTPEDLFDY